MSILLEMKLEPSLGKDTARVVGEIWCSISVHNF